MATITLRNNQVVADYAKPYIVAEVNSSHNGNFEIAKNMILAAKETGCDCVKFQSWSAESLYSQSYYDLNPISRRIVSKFSLMQEQLKELALFAESIGIGFSSTPYSEAEVDFLIDECNVPFIKIASMEINNPNFLRYIANKQVPIVLSTGMAEVEEVKNAVNVIEACGNKQICLLHCISIYPAAPDTINLNNIKMLREMFPNYPIGFSDHTLGTEIACAATALGSAFIEKHLTLNKKAVGMDNNMAIEPEDMKDLVKNCHTVQSAMGSKDRIVRQAECEQRLKMRRSLIALRDLPVGTVIQESDLGAKRPGDGIPPDKSELIIGKKLNKDIKAEYLIYLTDIE